MADPIARVLSGLTLVGVLFVTWSTWGVSAELDALHAAIDEVAEQEPAPRLVLPAQAPRPKAGKARKSKGKRAVQNSPRSPDAADRKARRRERIRARTSRMKEEFQAFSDEHGIDGETGQLVLEELQLAKESTALVRADVHDGRMSAKDGRTEIQALRADTDAALIDLLGDDTTAALKVRLADWLDKDEE